MNAKINKEQPIFNTPEAVKSAAQNLGERLNQESE